MRSSLLFVFLLLGCARQVSVKTPSLCDQLTDHAEGDAPSCEKIQQAFNRGCDRVKKVYSVCIPITDVLFLRPARVLTVEKPYPLIRGFGGEIVAAQTSVAFPCLIIYAYEEAIEHEAVHCAVHYLDGNKKRAAWAIAADPGQDASLGPPAEDFWTITCHGTPDDPFGIPGKRTSCDVTR